MYPQLGCVRILHPQVRQGREMVQISSKNRQLTPRLSYRLDRDLPKAREVRRGLPDNPNTLRDARMDLNSIRETRVCIPVRCDFEVP